MDIRLKAARDFANAVATQGFRFTAAQRGLMTDTLPFVKEQIVEGLRREAPGTRTDSYARLGGQSAADVFSSEAEIKDTST